MRAIVPALATALLLAALPAPGSAQETLAPGERPGVLAFAGEPSRIDEGGATLEIEAGSVDVPTRIDVTQLAESDVAPLGPGMTNVTRGPRGFRFGPHGATFKKHLRLTLPYDARLLPAGTTEHDVHAFFYDEASERWVALDRVGVDPSSQSIVSVTDHFTDIIAATLVVPTHPDVEAYAPTEIVDLKAADPAQGVRLMQPPQPSPMGDARLAYPLELPLGRNGMQPQIALTYKSEGANGWLGLGWDLRAPEISVDTRWGVPRYGMLPRDDGAIVYQSKETESYLFDGLALTPVAHRTAFADRSGDTKQFHARVEGSFDRVIRHGDHPSNFWWEVIDKVGTRSVYGDVPDMAGGPATLRDDSGNIFRWMLREVRDLSGNALRYEYDRVSDPGLPAGTVAGRQIYPRTVNYTGTAAEGAPYASGAYTVRFIRDSQLPGWVRRPDVEIDCRGGFKQVTAELLRRVRIEFNGALVREYELSYDTGAFGKTRLARMRLRGANGEYFAGHEHRFAYYDDVRNGSGAYTSGFAPETHWSMPSDDISLCGDLGPLDTCPSSFAADFDRASAMSGSITHGVAGHLYLGLNCGLPTKQNSAGVKTGFNVTRTEVNLGLFDVNGDNLPDKVFRSGSNFLYRENQARPGGPLAFSPVASPLGDVRSVSVETGVSTSAGVEQYFAGSSGIINATGTFTVGTTYSTDANGDGLVDIVRNGEILYSHLGPDGAPVFEPTSANTPMPLAAGSLDGEELIQDYEPLFQELLDQHPLHDVFRRWVAPYAGFVQVTGAARLAKPGETVDGVRVSVQHNGSVLWSRVIEDGDAGDHVPSGVERIAVQRGDRLYFRVQSVFDGAMDAVAWNAQIDYLDVSAPVDANLRDPYRFGAANDFVLAGRETHARMPFDGDVHLSGVFMKRDTTSDDVTLRVLRNGAELFRTTLPGDSVGAVPLDLRFTVAADDTATRDRDEADLVRVHLFVDSPIDATLVGWQPDAPPELVYESAPALAAAGGGSEPDVRLFVPFDMDLYAKTNFTAPQPSWPAPGGAFSVTTTLEGEWSFRVPTVEEPIRNGEVIFTVKRPGELLAKAALRVRDGEVENRTVRVEGASAGDRLFFDVSVRDGGTFGSLGAEIESDDEDEENEPVPVGLHANIPFDDVPVLGRGLFGQPYRGWTFAGYNGNPSRDSPERPKACTGDRVASTDPIRESALVLGEGLGDVDDDTDPDDLPGLIGDQKAYAFSPVYERVTDGTVRGAWRGPEDEGWLQGGEASATRLGMAFVGVPCPGDVGGGDPTVDSRAVPRIGTSVNAGAGAGYIISVSATVGASSNQLDFIDMNGDQFPDVVGNGRAQYTLPNGGLEAKSRSLGSIALTRSSTNAAGSISLGGSIPINIGGSRGTTAANNKSSPRGERSQNLMPSLGFSGDLGGGLSSAETDLIDINGDALPDRVNDNGTVALNLGYGFADAEHWPGLTEIDQATSLEFTLGVGLGFNDFIYGYAGGLSYSRAEQRTHKSFADLNGDGLLDRVREEGDALWVGFNTGSGFASEVRWQGAEVDAVASTASSSLGGGAYVTIPVPIFLCSPATVLFLIINPGATVSGAMARQEAALMDVNGDRCADYVQSARDDELIVSRNRTGRTNLLRRVDRPLGGSIVLDYSRTGNTPDLPHSAWALSRVELHDGVAGDGPSPLLTTFAYDAPRFDRGEREFYGFGEVLEQHRSADDPARIERTVARNYLNDNYYGKGLIRREATLDGEGRPMRALEQTYQYHDAIAGVFTDDVHSRTATILPMLRATETQILEGSASAVQSQRRFEYDAFGNVSRVIDTGDVGPEDDLEASITYAECPGSGVRARPVRIVITSNGATLAERQATVDCTTGDIEQIREYLADGTHADTDLEYYATGLLRLMRGPPDLHGQRYTRTYTYDPQVATHVTRVQDSFGLTSSATYDLRFGRPTSTTDANGNVITYTYDAFGRGTSVTGPYEQGSGTPALTFEYDIQAPVPWARSRHFDVMRATDPIETVLFTDGLGRVIQTKTDGTVHVSPDEPPRDMAIVSGRQRFDGLGRVAEQFQPVVEPPGLGTVFNPAFHPVAPSRTAFDALDRPMAAEMPDGSLTQYRYTLMADAAGRARHQTKVVDPRNNERRVERDARDLPVRVEDGTADVSGATYVYDALDRLAVVRDAHGNETRIEYDQLGRRTALIRPDAGTTRFEYDLASNLIARRTANLAGGEPIRYDYDYNRLIGVHYPEHPENDVTLEYGSAGAGNHAAGRIVRVTDAVGVEERRYGRLGEVVQQTRTITGRHGGNSPNATQSFTTKYAYDTWGRLLEITYPDGEVLAYTYNAGGLVSRVTGVDHPRTTEYVRRIEYDANQQRTYVELGNGVRTSFSYGPEDQRLVNLESWTDSGVFQNLKYAYDAAGNVTSILNDVPVQPPSQFGGPLLQEFEYDGLYRLTRATGSYQFSPNKRDEYALALRYDAIHNLLEKTQSHHVVTPSGQRIPQHKTSYAQEYRYHATRPHAPVHVGDRTYTFDANGNQTGWTHDRNGTRRTVEWDEDDRALSISNQGHKLTYAYDATGARILKRGPGGETAFVNQFFSMRNGQIGTKHIYVGNIRLASLVSKQPGQGRSPLPASKAKDVYYYHPDHLFSTQFITDAQGRITEHRQHFPSGEPWIEERRGPQVADLGFSGREYDDETGLYYFGMRYHDPRLNQFISADPFSDAAGGDEAASIPPALNVYSYAFGNPVRLIDPDGRFPGWWSGLRQTFSLFRGAIGRTLGFGRTTTATASVFNATDSPVRATAASSAGDFLAGGVGVTGAISQPTSGVNTRREMRPLQVRAALGSRAPPTAPRLARARPPAIVGENMAGRVIPYAKSVGGETIVDWLNGRTWTQQLNDDYINHLRATGRQVVDIGPDFPRRLQFKLSPPTDRGPRPVYESERQLLRGYANYRQIFIRTGKYEGGVAGLDFPGNREGGVSGVQP